tara:strand:- start:6924 stop:7232 length:309 start_codon:yes stop_codon:yes gene_type:complete
MLFENVFKQKAWESLEEAAKAAKDRIKRAARVFGSENPALVHQGENDYTLPKGSNSVWITVDEVAVYIRRMDNAIVAEIIKKDEYGELTELDEAVHYTGHET